MNTENIKRKCRRRRVVEVPENSMWTSEEPCCSNSGFLAFKRRINEQVQLMDLDVCVDDEDLLPFYRMGESENFVLGALGCSMV